MASFSRNVVSRLLLAGLCLPLATQTLPAQTTIRNLKLLGNKDTVEIEIEASDRIVPQTQVLTGPDRLVIDFPNSIPGSQLYSQSVYRGEVKDLRVALFQAKPPVTRVVLDLKTAPSYQVFPYGRTVMIKIMGGTSDTSVGVNDFAPHPVSRPGIVAANYTTRVEAVRIGATAQPSLNVSFRDGLLGIKANKVTLSDVLYAVQQRTGAEVSIAAGAEQEKIVADIAPGPAAEVLAHLLNGSRFNFLILSAPDDPRRLDRVILTARPDGGQMPLPQMQMQGDGSDDVEPESAQQVFTPPAPVDVPSKPEPEMKASPDDNPQDH
jgi:hypothetical protein